jgi:MtN3 and saliva related transmembrane protein
MQFAIENLGYIAAFCTTSSFLPQAILTIRTKDTESLSLGMYGLFTTGLILWLIYGFYKQDYALIFGNAVTLILASTILFFKIKSLVAK